MIPLSGLSRFSGLFDSDGPSPLNRDTTVVLKTSKVKKINLLQLQVVQLKIKSCCKDSFSRAILDRKSPFYRKNIQRPFFLLKGAFSAISFFSNIITIAYLCFSIDVE